MTSTRGGDTSDSKGSRAAEQADGNLLLLLERDVQLPFFRKDLEIAPVSFRFRAGNFCIRLPGPRGVGFLEGETVSSVMRTDDTVAGDRIGLGCQTARDGGTV